MQIPPPPNLDALPAGTKLIAGLSESTIIPAIDFETYSPAGFVWNQELNKWQSLQGATDKGLFATGTAVYTEHPDAEVLSLSYDLKNGKGRQLWLPIGCYAPRRDEYDWSVQSPGIWGEPPLELVEYVIGGGLVEAWNVAFEYWVWNNICVKKYNFPPLPREQLRCAMAKARAFALPGSLDGAGEVLRIVNKKHKDGRRLLNKFSIPQTPTKKDPRLRILCKDEPEDAKKLYEYNLQDIAAEAEISRRVPDLTSFELEYWQCDQDINYRGVQVDLDAIDSYISIVRQAHTKYNAELITITNGAVNAASEIQRLRAWLETQGVFTESLDAENLAALLKRTDLNPLAYRALQIRDLIGSAAVKKLYAMKNQATKTGRLHNLFIYHAARTGRAASGGPQLQNLPKNGPSCVQCPNCNKFLVPECSVRNPSTFSSRLQCPWCGEKDSKILDQGGLQEWEHIGADAIEDVLEVIKTESLECVEYFFKDAITAISGCIRGLLIAKPDHELIGSDFSAIEAVVNAALAGEEWRLEVFRTHGKIYEMSAAKITGMDFDEYLLYKATTGHHHKDRRLGKVAELAGGFGGGVGAWKNAGADEFLSEEEIKKAVYAWRNASPAIVEFWGGQRRGWQEEYYGLEGMAISAVLNPGKVFDCRGIKFLVHNDILYCILLSGRPMAYHKPRLSPAEPPFPGLSLSFEGWNSNPKKGKMGWIRMKIYGGAWCENVVQASARDILAYATIQVERAGYPVVMHIHDEICSEILKGFGSVENFEKILGTLPTWAKDWPIRAAGGWRGKRYRK